VMTKSKEVTRESFEIFLRWLAPEQEKLGEAYEKLRFRLITFFSARRCFYAEELADEVINRIVAVLEKEVIENKTGYIYGVARNVFLESLRKEKKHVNIDDLSLPAKAPPAPDFSNECLEQCLEKLSPDKRELILDYFSEDKSEKIAAHKKASGAMRITQTALRMRVLRIKQQLSDCVKDCMK
jgi:DNA-directed RNA polymerase specialized sigma24 family protein